MNAQHDTIGATSFELNPKLNLERLRENFHSKNRVRVRNFLQSGCAEQIYKHLSQELPWRTFVVANEQLMATEPAELLRHQSETDKEIFEIAYAGVRHGFACAFDADRLYLEDLTGTGHGDAGCGSRAALDEYSTTTRTLDAFERFLNSCLVTELLRRVTGLTAERLTVRTRAMRFRAGQFMSFHNGTWSADTTRERRAAFYLNLTPEWRPEWGGMLEFRTSEADCIEAYMPSFNTLDVFGFPHGSWIAPIAPFASDSVFCVAGRIYIS